MLTRLLAGLTILVAPAVGYAQKTSEGKSAPARQTIERRAPIARDASIRVAGAISSLKIIGWDHDSLAITGSAPADARFDGGVGASTPTSPSRGAKFYLETYNGLFGGGNLELRVPHGARVWAKSGSATIEVTGVTGALDLNVVGGSVVVSSRPRELNIEAMDGDVRVMAGADWLRVKTATGAIEVRAGSEDAGLSTVSGPIRVFEGRYDRGKFETVTGDITYRGDFGFRGSMDITTHSGRVELQLPPRPDLELDAATVTGSIDNAVTSTRPITGREGRGMELGFSSGNGNTRVVVRSFKGNIALKPR